MMMTQSSPTVIMLDNFSVRSSLVRIEHNGSDRNLALTITMQHTATHGKLMVNTPAFCLILGRTDQLSGALASQIKHSDCSPWEAAL